MTHLAKAASFIFHPLLMPLYGLLLILHSSTYLANGISPSVLRITLLTVFIFTCLLPLMNVLFLKRKGWINSIYLETKEERKLPYLFTVIYYIVLYYFLKELQLPPILYLLFLGSTLAAIMVLIINLRWKISAHMTGMGGVIGAIIGLSERLMIDLNNTMMALFLIAGLVGSSRLYLNAHSPAQIFTGFFLGLSCFLFLILSI